MKQKMLDVFGLLIIGVISLGYVLFKADFAELHIQFSFLSFPVFIGEILLFICLILFILKQINTPLKLTKWHYVMIAYFGFIVAKALYGYVHFGPLAFRHAALFYYPAFMIFGAAFYRKDLFDKKIIFGLLFLILCVFFSGQLNIFESNFLTLTVLAGILILAFPNKKIRMGLAVVFVIFTPYKLFFQAARTLIVSNCVAGIYMVFSFFIILKGQKIYKFVIVGFGIIFIVGGIIKFSGDNTRKSIFDFRGIIETFNEYNVRVMANIDDFEMENREAQVFHSNKEIREKSEEKRILYVKTENKRIVYLKTQIQNTLKEEKKDQDQVISFQMDIKEKEGSDVIRQEYLVKIKDELKQIQIKQINEKQQNKLQKLKVKDRGLQGANNNTVYRLLIWRDMVVEFWSVKPILGIDFGKPFRSISLEILNWGGNEWRREGWVTAHNSYLDMIYRAGVVGIFFILTVIVILMKMILRFLQQRSLKGILLCAIIINWFVAANFLLIFELPYTAIPLWTIYGMTFAYFKQLPHTDSSATAI